MAVELNIVWPWGRCGDPEQAKGTAFPAGARSPGAEWGMRLCGTPGLHLLCSDVLWNQVDKSHTEALNFLMTVCEGVRSPSLLCLTD